MPHGARNPFRDTSVQLNRRSRITAEIGSSGRSVTTFEQSIMGLLRAGLTLILMEDGMRIVIIGATGKTGRHLLEQAVAQGHAVTALARDPDKLSDVSGVRVVQGDVYDFDSVRDVVRGHDAVLAALTPRGNPLKPVDLFSLGGGNLVRAMEAEGVDRLIFVTSAGVEKSDPSFPLWMRWGLMPILHHVYDDARRFEDLVRKSSISWTVVRPPRLVDGPRKGTYRVSRGFTPPGPLTLARADLADFMLRQLHDRSFVHATPAVAD
jgi:putative NADH-flavin reductase